MENIIEIKNLTKIYGSNPKKAMKCIDEGLSKSEILESTGMTVGLKDINFEVKPGETFVIMGLSGSGKSTLIRCLNLLHKPSFGEINILDKNIVKLNKKDLREFRKNNISMVFQNFGLFNHMNVIENVQFGLEMKKTPNGKRYKLAKEAIESVGLEGYEESEIGDLSGGMKQRVGLARALANNPDILLMDEPFSALDPLIKKEMHEELLDLQSKLKKTIVFITHDVNEAFKLGDRIAVLKDGELIQIGTPTEFISNPENEYIEKFIEDVDKLRVIKCKDIMRKNWLKIGVESSPKVAIMEMEKVGKEIVVSVDKNRQPLGYLTLDDCIYAKKNDKALSEFVKKDYIKVNKDVYVKDIIEDVFTTPYPVVVRDKTEKMIGVIPRAKFMQYI
ncbi:MAG: glycine betaine/L-proline ABC transporter ATP-binding protein [Firmicutes bacterium]|jgi:glycine betaine/proline transport system ATP-binding protein|nr:glycine betaine/L-proline ABC transporter ATP-binding protein [Bacillota bacterium]